VGTDCELRESSEAKFRAHVNDFAIFKSETPEILEVFRKEIHRCHALIAARYSGLGFVYSKLRCSPLKIQKRKKRDGKRRTAPTSSAINNRRRVIKGAAAAGIVISGTTR
jgi:hypothetical protein